MSNTPANNEQFVTQEQFELITESEAKFILEHGEKQLKEINDTALQIVARSSALLTINVGFVVALIGFCMKKWAENNHLWDTELFVAFFLALYFSIIIIIISINLIPKSYQMLGADPADFFNTQSVFVKSNSSYRMIAIYTNEIIQIQKKLTHNKLKNEKRWWLFNLALLLLALAPIIVLLIYWIASFKVWNLISK